jgi:hypothetical protein
MRCSKIPTSIDIPKLSQNSISELSRLYKDITQEFEFVSAILKHDSNAFFRDVAEFENPLEMNNFISPKIKQELINSRNIQTLQFYLPTNTPEKLTMQFYTKSHEKAPKFLAKKLAAIYFAMKNQFRPEMFIPNMVVRIFQSKQGKKLTCQNFNGKDQCVVGPNNVNSGSSYIGWYRITLWRLEEIEKVWIHELIHALGLDNTNDESLVRILKKRFNLDGGLDVLPGEAYTEAWAAILNLIFRSGSENRDQNKITTRSISNFLDKLNGQRRHAVIQVKKLLNYYGIKSTVNLNKLRQKSAVFSYYILKCLYLYFLNNFVDMHQNIFQPHGKLYVTPKSLSGFLDQADLDQLDLSLDQSGSLSTRSNDLRMTCKI